MKITDFNDLHQAHGLQAVRQMIDEAIESKKAESEAATVATVATVATHEETNIAELIAQLPTIEERNQARALYSALGVILKGDYIGDSATEAQKIVGYGLAHEYKQEAGIGRALVDDWSGRTGGNAFRYFLGADLKISDPITAASIFELAKTKGWTLPNDCIEWQEPETITAHYETEDYPLDQLPDPLRLLIIETVDYLQCPVAMAVNSLLGALSVTTQGLVNVARDSQLLGVTSLFLMVIAESGERKSACDDLLTKHLQAADIERYKADLELKKAYAKELKTWQTELKGAENALLKSAEKGLTTVNEKQRIDTLYLSEPQQPRSTQFLQEDTTPEGLIKAMSKGHPSIGIFSSEAGIVFGSHGMNSESLSRNLATLNKGWDGGTFRVSRADTEKNILLTGRRLTLNLAIQASTVRAFFEGSKGLARGTGFGARFLIAWPKSTQGTRLYKEPAAHTPYLDAFRRKTLELIHTELTMDETGAIEAHTLILSSKAKNIWQSFFNDTECELRTGGELTGIKDVVSKAADNAARIAALFHVYEHGTHGAISEDHMTKACHLMAWYLMESRRFFGEIALPKELSNAILLDTWILDYCKDNQVTRISTRTAKQLCPNSLRANATFTETLKTLAEAYRVRTTTEGKKKWLEINPKLLEA